MAAQSSFNAAVAQLAKMAQVAGNDDNNEQLTQEELDRQKAMMANVDFRMVTFSLAGKDYAIDILKVKEIAKAGHFTYVPNTMPFVRGVHNLRGDIIPVIDLRLFFNVPVQPKPDNALENMLIVTVGDQTFGVVVDVIDRVIGIQSSTIQPPHPLFGDINIKYIYGVVEADNRLFVLLDIDRIFGRRTAEEEAQYAQQSAQMQHYQAAQQAMQQAAQVEGDSAQESERAPEENAAPQADIDYTFIVDSLKTLKKFTVNGITEPWVKQRYEQWIQERGKENTQLQNEADADAFLAPFYSRFNSTWWSESFANEIAAALPDNPAKTIVVWNAGCGKGYESYSLACLLKKRYPNSNVRIYAHDIDLLSVSNAPLLSVPEEVSTDWYQPYLTKTVTGEYTFSKEIKDMIMFEYHDCVHTNTLPDIDIVFCRDLVSFLPEDSQRTLLTDFEEKVKGNGIAIVGDNEDITAVGWKKQNSGSVAVYTKK